MNKEDRYIVIKKSDLDMAKNAGKLSTEELNNITLLLETIQVCRINNGKPVLNCLVVESDWPEYEVLWNLIEKRVDEK